MFSCSDAADSTIQPNAEHPSLDVLIGHKAQPNADAALSSDLHLRSISFATALQCQFALALIILYAVSPYIEPQQMPAAVGANLRPCEFSGTRKEARDEHKA